MINYKSLIQEIRNAQKKIEKRIRDIQEQLKKLEDVPSSQPWITKKRTTVIAELRSPHVSLKQALNNDLMLLRQQLRQLNQQVKTLKNRAALQNAAQARKDLENKFEEMLKKAERGSGGLSDEEMDVISQQSADVLDKYVTILDTNPTPENVKGVLENIYIPLLSSGSGSAGEGAVNRATGALGRASDKIRDKAEKNFRSSPTVDNFDSFLGSQELGQLVGGSELKKPVGWEGVNKVHPVKPGDTLSKISQQYYGKTSYWDIIYMDNYGAIGDDPNDLKVGQELFIP